MLFTISGKHIEITQALKQYAEEKTSKLPKYYNNINQVEVIIDGSGKDNPQVEIIARAEHSKIFIANESGKDAYQCIDAAVHKLERQITKEKTKERDAHKHIGDTEIK